MVILGIDPGLQFTGFGIIKKVDRTSYLLDYGYLPLPAAKPIPVRIAMFHEFFTEKITKHGVTDIAFETPFLGKNAQNYLKLGYLRGIIYLLSEHHQIKLHEFAPREVKQMVTGFGGASKEQVARAVLQFFPAITKPNKEDVTDALAVTLCGLWHHKRLNLAGLK
jgi:crossover junction endodeoxyribonuclease RuvC